ncbi:hypothetical protein LJC17_01285 [Acholeplasma sp. OttesenSCG-928-E16]|nr:hypothetical protein [Acholeplasma sp. OttesenSCG-928-E16]
MKKLLLIDGHSLLFQMYYGMPNKIKNKDGNYIEGIIGFLGALRKIIGLISPDYIHLVFDGETNNPNKILDSNYKANRVDYSKEEAENNPFFQLPYIYDCLNKLNFSFEESVACECDDVIAGIVKKYQNDYKIIICSKDSDFFQLINDNVEVFRYAGKNSVFWTKSYFIEKYQFEPKLLVTYKSLTGDQSDNVKGLLGVGPKTATKIIKDYGDLNNLYDNLDKIESIKLKDQILENKDRLFTNHQIINLMNVDPYELDFKKLDVYIGDYQTIDVLLKLGIGY